MPFYYPANWCKGLESNQVIALFRRALNHQTSSPYKMVGLTGFEPVMLAAFETDAYTYSAIDPYWHPRPDLHRHSVA